MELGVLRGDMHSKKAGFRNRNSIGVGSQLLPFRLQLSGDD